MNYEQKYKESLERARDLHDNHPYGEPPIWKACEDIFPELRESEDERIRKAISYAIANSTHEDGTLINGVTEHEAIAWLEKQGTPQVRTGIEWVNAIDDACDKRYSEEYAEGEYCHEQSFKWGFQEGVDWLEKQSEQKTIEQDTETHDLWVYIREWNDKFGRLPKDEDELASCIDYVMKRQKPEDLKKTNVI